MVRTRANVYLQDNTSKETQKNNMIIFSKKSLKKGQIIAKDDLVFKNVKKSSKYNIFN